MSGGKETPRQKMIGMMYLVLTALLALNVSNAVLQKFEIVDATLGGLISDDDNGNATKLESIKNVPVMGEKETAVKKQAAAVRELTKTTLTYLDGVKTKMSSERDGKKIEPGELVTNTNRSEELMLDHQHPETGQGYEKELDDYVTNLNKIMALPSPSTKMKAFDKLTKTAAEYDAFKADKEQTKKDFLDFSFEGVPTMAAIATVSQMQTEILEYEKVTLDTLLARVKGQIIEVDQLLPMVDAEASVLVAGQTYNGNLFVAGSSSGGNPEMYFGSSKLAVEDVDISGIKTKMGKIKFKVAGTTYDKDGRGKGSYHVKITLPKRTLVREISYTILRPQPRFASAAANKMYINCGNEVTVTIPGLTGDAGLNLSIDNPDDGSVSKLAPGKFVIIPKRPKCPVKVSLDGTYVSTEDFNSNVPAPIPFSKIMYGNTQYKPDVGLPAGTANIRIECNIVPPDFKDTNRKDANYRVTSFVLVVNGAPIPQTGNSLNVAAYNLRSGASFVISNVKVVRTTYDGKTVEVSGSEMGEVIKIK